MLTCPPTRINLTSSDLASFDRRFAAKQASRPHGQDADLRLRPTVGRLTKLGFVPAHANTGRKRADSCSSQATICTEDPHPASPLAADEPLSPPRLPKGSHAGKEDHDHPLPPPAHSQLDGTTESTQAPVLKMHLPLRPVPSGPHPLPHSTTTLHTPVEPTSNSARVSIVRQFHMPVSHTRGIAHIPITIALPNDSHQPWAQFEQDSTGELLPNPLLDPGAPVFVPTTRFGSTASGSTESANGGVRLSPSGRVPDHAPTRMSLRVRSSFERNTQHSSSPSHESDTTAIGIAITDEPADTTHGRRRNLTNDQNAALQRPIPNLDRYPAAIRPRQATSSSNGSHGRVVFPRRRSSRQHLIDFERTSRRQNEYSQHAGSAISSQAFLTVPAIPERLRAASPVASTSSRSTPNLLNVRPPPPVHTRSSSFSWRQDAEQRPELPEEVPARASNSDTRRGVIFGSAFEQYWLNRDSPLDELAQQLDSLTTRPRSVGRSFGRPPGGHERPSLLTGDTFRMEPSPDRQRHGSPERSPLATLKQEPSTSRRVQHSSEPHPTLFSPTRRRFQPSDSAVSFSEDPVALSLALPSPDLPSSPAVRISPRLPSTPSVQLNQPSTSASPLELIQQPSSSSATPSSQSIHETPRRFPVYDDSRPPGTQPRTPADLLRTARRGRGRSETASETAVLPTPSNPGRLQRHTYPTATPPQQIPEESTISTRNVRTEQQSDRENEVEGGPELESDVRTWMRRREEGDLDVTPEREGRFERYLV